MVNLDQAQKNVRNAQNQLDQALKELEKAKKPKVWEQEFPDRVFFSTLCGTTVYSQDGPCKVTVRPLGGPEPVVFETMVEDCTGYYNGCCRLMNRYHPGLEGFRHKPVRVTVEEVVE